MYTVNCKNIVKYPKKGPLNSSEPNFSHFVIRYILLKENNRTKNHRKLCSYWVDNLIIEL